jgi:hypothetical protein
MTALRSSRPGLEKNGQFSTAVSAITAKAKLARLWLEKRENLNRIDPNQLMDDGSEVTRSQAKR